MITYLYTFGGLTSKSVLSKIGFVSGYV